MSRSRTPSHSSARTPAGMMPSPHALSGEASLRSKTATDSPRRAAAMATASPAGPAPTTATSSVSPTEEPRNQPRPIPKDFGVALAERALLFSNANGENGGVADRKRGGRVERTVNERDECQL